MSDAADESVLSWSGLTSWRRECFERYGPVTDLPLCSPSEELKVLLGPDTRVLDIGSGDQAWVRRHMTAPGQQYRSLDVDPNVEPDFYSFEDIPRDTKFDLLVANQVLEHLTVSEAMETVHCAYSHAAEGARFFATVPNAAHPVRQWGDATHITAWPVFDLYSLFRFAGFEVVFLGRFNKLALPSNPLKRFVVRTVCQAFRVDWCDSLLLVAAGGAESQRHVAQ